MKFLAQALSVIEGHPPVPVSQPCSCVATQVYGGNYKESTHIEDDVLKLIWESSPSGAFPQQIDNIEQNGWLKNKIFY